MLNGNGNTSTGETTENRARDILALPNMFQIAKLVAETLRNVIGDMQGLGQEASSQFDVTMILGGQIFGEDTKLFLIYPEGNFIEVSDDQPFFQVGETKYGKPILVRAYDEKLDFEDAVKLLLLSFDSTMKANLSVGLPLDLVIYERDSFTISHRERITQDNAYFQFLSNAWGARLKNAFEELPDFQIIAPK
jgi:putative proteasome-type protease